MLNRAMKIFTMSPPLKCYLSWDNATVGEWPWALDPCRMASMMMTTNNKVTR